MESEKLNNLERANLELVLKNQLEEMEKNSQVLSDAVTAINELRSAMNRLESKLENQDVTTTAPDILSFQKSIENKTEEIKRLIIKLYQPPRPTTFQVFLQSDAKKWLVILVTSILFLTYLYWLCREWLGRG